MGSIRHHDRPTFTPVNYSTANATLPSRARLQDRQPSHAIDEGSSSSEETLGSERANCALKKRRLETPTSDSTDHNQKNKKDEHKEVEKRRRGEHKDLIDDLKMLYPDGLSDFLRGNLNIDALKSHTKDHKESKNSVLTTAIIFLEAVMIVLTRMFKRYSTLSEDYRNLEEKCHRLEIELKQKSRTQLSIASLCLSDDNSDRPSHVALRDCRKRPNSDLISTSEIPWLADVKAEALRIGKKREEVLICKKQGKEGNLAGKKQPSHSIGKVLHTK
ncbi:MAG: hypothetical protein MMC33_005102 [Icmadophila ericetorum]|nr:hypothetical protein [Icmadophila ericetorum]